MPSASFRQAPATRHRDALAAPNPPVAGLANEISDDQSAYLKRAFYRSGGVATGDEIALVLRANCDQPVSLLARWIVKQQVISFVWRSQRYIPTFQFELDRCSLRTGIAETISELSDAFDELEIVRWFVKPNGWLANAAPAEVALCDTQAVLDAARADRFIVLG